MKAAYPNLILTGLLVFAGVSETSAAPPEDQGHFETRSRRLMGTRFAITAYVTQPSQREAIDRALDRVAELEALWSPWIKGSDVAKVNRAAGDQGVPVSPETVALLQRSHALCLKTGRAFDPTFFALSPLYDFRESPFRPPTAAAIARALPKVDCRNIHIDPSRRTISLAKKGMRLHLGGNAKGTALDEAARILKAAKITRLLVDGGGDLVVEGAGPKGAWRVGVRDPRGRPDQLLVVLPVSSGAVATSGDYERYAMVGDKRYHHILDARTGLPATGCASATVVVPSGRNAGELADSLATTLCILGTKQGFELLRSFPGVKAGVMTQAGDWVATQGFPAKASLVRPLGD